MNLSVCPYCNLPGLVTTVKVHGRGLEVTGQCATCGYRCDSEYAPSDQSDDLPDEFSRPLEMTVAD